VEAKMKNFMIIAIIFLVILTACSGDDGSGIDCRESYCIELSIAEPISALELTLVTVSVQTFQDLPDLAVSLHIDPDVIFYDVIQMPENATFVIDNSRFVHWELSQAQSDTYIYSVRVIFPEPNLSYGIAHFGLDANTSSSSDGPITDGLIVYLGPEGNQIPEATANVILKTGYPVPTPRPDLTVIVPTPFPTPIWRTAEPGLPAYPPPEATLPPYP